MFEAYSVAVKLSLINNVSSGLLAISKNLMSTHADAAKLEQKLASIGKQAALGGLMFGGGMAIANMLKGPLEEAKKLAQAQADFSTLNLGAANNAKVFAAAAANAHKNLGMTITDNIKTIQDLHTAMGNLPHALEYLPSFSQFAIAAKIKNGGKDVDGLVVNAAKALEHRGDKVMLNPAEFNKELGMMSQIYFGSNARVNPNDYFHASQTGKMAYAMFDRDFLFGQFAGYMSTKTGSSAGTSAMTAFSSLVGGHMDNKAKGFLAGLGLLQVGVSPEQVRLTHEAVSRLHLPAKDAKKLMGAMMPVTGGLLDKYIEMYTTRPDLFNSTILAPAIRKKYGANLTNEQVAAIEAKHFNRGTSDFLGSLTMNQVKFAKDTEIFKKSMAFGDAYKMYKESPEGAELAAGVAWKNLLALVGSVYLPTVTRGLEKLAVWLDQTGQFVEKNRGYIKGLVGALAGLSAILITGGLINMIAAAGRGFNLLSTAAFGLDLMPVARGMNAITMATGKMELGVVASQLGGVGTALATIGAAASTFMAAYAGWETGKAIYNNMDRSTQNDVGGTVATVLAWFGNKNAQHALDVNDGNGALGRMRYPAVPPRQQVIVHINQPINLDGKKIAQNTTMHQARAANAPATGSPTFDKMMGVLQPGMPSMVGR